MFSCLQILEAFLWFVLITLLNVTLIILTLSVSRLLNLLLRLVAFLRSEERFSRNAETDLVWRPLLEKQHCHDKEIRIEVRLQAPATSQPLTPLLITTSAHSRAEASIQLRTY